MSRKKENTTIKENITNDIQKADAVKMSFDDIIKNNLIEKTIEDRATYNNIDLQNCPLNHWKMILQEAGFLLWGEDRKPLRIEQGIVYHGAVRPSGKNTYDMYKIKKVCDVYVYLSHKYNKIISMPYFSYLLYMLGNELYNLLDNNQHNESLTEFNNIRTEILKKIYSEREENIKEKCLEASSPVGYIAIGNTEYGWNGGTTQGITTGQAQRLDALPDLSGLKALNG